MKKSTKQLLCFLVGKQTGQVLQEFKDKKITKESYDFEMLALDNAMGELTKSHEKYDGRNIGKTKGLSIFSGTIKATYDEFMGVEVDWQEFELVHFQGEADYNSNFGEIILPDTNYKSVCIAMYDTVLRELNR